MDKSTTIFLCVFFLLVLVNVSQSCPQIWLPVKSPFYLGNYENILNGYVERGLFKSPWDQVENASNRRMKRDDSYINTHFGNINIIEKIRKLCMKFLWC